LPVYGAEKGLVYVGKGEQGHVAFFFGPVSGKGTLASRLPVEWEDYAPGSFRMPVTLRTAGSL
jgi:hypothetical protein